MLSPSKAIPPVMLPSPITAIARAWTFLKMIGDRNTQAGGNGSAGMTCPVSVILALGTLRKTTDSAILPQGAKLLLAPGQKLVCISLMPNVPDETVMGGIEYIMQCYGQFHHTETGGKMPAGFGNGAYDAGTNFLSQIEKLLIGQSF